MHPESSSTRHQPLLRRGSNERGLLVSERLGAAEDVRRLSHGAKTSGNRLDLRRRFHYRLERDGELRWGRSRAQRCRVRQFQLSPRCSGIHGAPGAYRGEPAQGLRQLRVPGPSRGLELGPTQHRGIQRRCRQRDHHGSVRRLDVGVQPAGKLANARVVSASRRYERGAGAGARGSLACERRTARREVSESSEGSDARGAPAASR